VQSGQRPVQLVQLGEQRLADLGGQRAQLVAETSFGMVVQWDDEPDREHLFLDESSDLDRCPGGGPAFGDQVRDGQLTSVLNSDDHLARQRIWCPSGAPWSAYGRSVEGHCGAQPHREVGDDRVVRRPGSGEFREGPAFDVHGPAADLAGPVLGEAETAGQPGPRHRPERADRVVLRAVPLRVPGEQGLPFAGPGQFPTGGERVGVGTHPVVGGGRVLPGEGLQEPLFAEHQPATVTGGERVQPTPRHAGGT
jgi:hypothetical protein